MFKEACLVSSMYTQLREQWLRSPCGSMFVERSSRFLNGCANLFDIPDVKLENSFIFRGFSN